MPNHPHQIAAPVTEEEILERRLNAVPKKQQKIQSTAQRYGKTGAKTASTLSVSNSITSRGM